MERTYDFPGFVDVHVHFRDPGMTTAETTASGLAAAAAGGIAGVVTMPNTAPACDSEAAIERQRQQARECGSPVALWPSAAITAGRQGGRVADLEALAAAGAAFFTDDGAYVADDRVMEDAMRRAAALGMTVCDHALAPGLVAGGVIRDCPLARRLGLPIISAAAETTAVARDVALCRVTGCRVHIQHISTAGGVDLVRSAQREGLPVTAEATPHHLLFACDELVEDDPCFKMAPPLGNREDRSELRRAVKDGVLMFATDHAPHPVQTKSCGFAGSANGITGLECAIGATYRAMVEEEGMSVDAWARAWYDKPLAIVAPAARERSGELRRTVVRIGPPREYRAEDTRSLSRNSPYYGFEFSAWGALQ